jgi:hypothetical protein
MSGDSKNLQRLIEMGEAATPEEVRLRDLVQASGNIEVSDASKQKIYTAVLVRRHARPKKQFAVLRPAVVFGVLLVAAGATAAATLGHRWMQQPRHPVAPPAAPAPIESHTRAATPRVAVTAPPADEISASAPETRRSHTPRARGRNEEARERSEDPSAVVNALEALRKQREPERAAKLLAGYLASNPRGALAEEALALSIEAAAALHDPAASEFARRYLREYPTGRFRQTANAALARR